jgi:hypothetical protein
MARTIDQQIKSTYFALRVSAAACNKTLADTRGTGSRRVLNAFVWWSAHFPTRKLIRRSARML